MNNKHHIPKIGSKEYKQFIQREVEQYEDTYKDKLKEQVPDIWHYVERHFKSQIKRKTGAYGFAEYVARIAKAKGTVKIYSLGAGACGVEIEDIAPLLKKYNVEYEFLCTDINPHILKKAEAAARKRNINLKTKVVDGNTLKLPADTYDIILAYASLHHLINLDKVTREINKALKPDGVFVTVDVPTRNGFMMWPETYALVWLMWLFLPTRYKISHTRAHEPVLVRWLDNIDYGKVSFECINSEDVLPSLRKNLIEKDYVPALAIMRRFFDTQYGPNYDLRKKFDHRLFVTIRALDTFLSNSSILKPETFFGAYSKKL